MSLSRYHAALDPLIERLEDAKVVVDSRISVREDRKLVEALKDGSYGQHDLDFLFEIIQKPLLAAITIMVFAWRDDGRIFPQLFEDPTDRFINCVDMIARRKYVADGIQNVPPIDLLTPDVDDSVHGRKGAAQVGLVRRLIASHGTDQLEATIDRIDSNRITDWAPKVTKEQCLRYLRLIAPIEREAPIPILLMTSPTGTLISSEVIGNTMKVRDTYPGLDK